MTEPLVKQCVVCGHDHDRHGELCPRCQREVAGLIQDWTELERPPSFRPFDR